MHRWLAAPLLAFAAGCGSSKEDPEPVDQPPEVLPGARGAAVEIPTSRELEEIARLEDARSLGDGRLIALLREGGDPRVRSRAAMALGRFPYPSFGAEVTEALARALEDPELDVRMAATFALGVRADPASAGTLLAYRDDPQPLLRARVVEAASKIPDPSMHAEVLLSLRDTDLAVRMEAAVGAARWSPAEPDASEVDRALLDALSPYRITREAAPKSAVEAELVWRILWALGRRKAELGRGPFLEYADSEIPLERMFALRGLAQLRPDPAALRAVLVALSGPATSDWRSAYEAAGALGRFAASEPGMLDAETARLLASEAVLQALESAAEHSSAHVRAGAMEALAGFDDDRRVLALLQRGRLDVSAGVRVATLRARVRLGSPDDTLDALRRGARDDDPVLRGAAAEAAGTVRDEHVLPVLLELARDPSLFVATRAVEHLGQHPSDPVRAELHGFLAHPDNGLRLAAVLALKNMPSPGDVAALELAAVSSSGDIAPEVAYNALQVLAAIGTGEARAVVERFQSDPRPYVRRVAKRLVREVFGGTPSEGEPPFAVDREVPLAGKDYPLYRFNPLVEVVTSRGAMVFELFPAEAPVHVHSFLTLVQSGSYEGLTFHRVVPGFVVQGGDYRGDGNGGSQFFVTHVPTPHLDGRYTIFGELRTGGSVLDQLEVGDRILSARLLE